MSNFAEFFQDHTGGNSSMRLMALAVILGVFVVWAVVSIDKMVLVEIPQSVVEFVGGLLIAKVWQVGIETKNFPAGTN